MRDSKRNERKMALNIGRTARLMNEGLSPEEIAAKMNKPLEEVNEWIGIINKALENKG